MSFEYLIIHVTTKGASFIVTTVYRPGSVRPDKHFYSEFTKFLGALTDFATPATIVGDINIRIYRQNDSDANTLFQLLSNYYLKQCVTQRTHNLRELLDVLITSNSNVP